ncbi:MAG: hypothetical protein IJO08_00170 [Clostridia bacterium]|nr:hypothetical protein [Clostridia bacterium]
MKFQKKVLALTGMLVLGAGACLAANMINEEITAIKSYDINIKYNGELQTMYDANGKQVFPLSYEGTTYVPVRAVSNIFGVPVAWDAETKTVLLGENDEWREITKEDILYVQKYWVNENLNFEYDGVKYEKGYKEVSKSGWNVASANMELSLNNEYKTLAFKLVSEADIVDNEANLTVVVRDMDTKKEIYRNTMTSNSSLDVEVDVEGHDHIIVELDDDQTRKWCNGSTTYLLDIKVK